MKVFIVLSALIVAVSAGGYGSGNLAGYGNSAGVSTGASNQFRHDDEYGNYNFGYEESHNTGSTSRREEETNGIRRGSYSLSDADGRRRTVNYVADAAGFRATVDTNEPGTESKSPADVIFNGAAPAASGYMNSGMAAQGYGAAQSWTAAPIATTAYATQMAAPRFQAAPQVWSAPAQTVSYQQQAAPAFTNTWSAAPMRMNNYQWAAPRQQQQQVISTYSAPAPQIMRSTYTSAPVAATTTYLAPAAPMRSYSAPVQAATYATVAAPAIQAYQQQAIEAPAPRAFSYSFQTAHPTSVMSSAIGSYGSGSALSQGSLASYGSGASYGSIGAPAISMFTSGPSFSNYQMAAPAFNSYQQGSALRSSSY